MALVSKEQEELTVEERNLLSVAYKNAVGSRRASWRIVSSVEQKELTKKNADGVARTGEYRKALEKELDGICDKILNLLDEHLIPRSSSGESKVFYFKMKGDYFRYIAEYKVEEAKTTASEAAHEAYKSA